MIVLQFHLEPTDTSELEWWVDSPDLPNLVASAPSLANCQRLAFALLDDLHIDPANVSYVLAGEGRLSPRSLRSRLGFGSGDPSEPTGSPCNRRDAPSSSG
jgi:hypothetical protein